MRQRAQVGCSSPHVNTAKYDTERHVLSDSLVLFSAISLFQYRLQNFIVHAIHFPLLVDPHMFPYYGSPFVFIGHRFCTSISTLLQYAGCSSVSNGTESPQASSPCVKEVPSHAVICRAAVDVNCHDPRPSEGDPTTVRKHSLRCDERKVYPITL